MVELVCGLAIEYQSAFRHVLRRKPENLEETWRKLRQTRTRAQDQAREIEHRCLSG